MFRSLSQNYNSAYRSKYLKGAKEFAVSFVDDPFLLAGGLGTTAKVVTKTARYVASAEIVSSVRTGARDGYLFVKDAYKGSILASEVGVVGRDITPLIKAERLLKSEVGDVRFIKNIITETEDLDDIRKHISGVKELIDMRQIQKAEGLLNEPIFMESYKNVLDGAALFEVNRANIEVRKAISFAEKGQFDEARKIINKQLDRVNQVTPPG